MRRDVGGAGCGARGRGMNAPPTPRAVTGLRPGAIRPRARSWLTAGQHGTPDARRCGPRKGSYRGALGRRRMVAESAARHRKTPHGAPKGAASSSKGMMRVNYALSRRAIPSLLQREKKTGLPRAATKNRGEDACLAQGGQARRALYWLFLCSPGERSETRDSHAKAPPRISLRSSGLQCWLFDNRISVANAPTRLAGARHPPPTRRRMFPTSAI
jgi:hypothetical protein